MHDIPPCIILTHTFETVLKLVDWVAHSASTQVYFATVLKAVTSWYMQLHVGSFTSAILEAYIDDTNNKMSIYTYTYQAVLSIVS